MAVEVLHDWWFIAPLGDAPLRKLHRVVSLDQATHMTGTILLAGWHHPVYLPFCLADLHELRLFVWPDGPRRVCDVSVWHLGAPHEMYARECESKGWLASAELCRRALANRPAVPAAPCGGV